MQPSSRPAPSPLGGGRPSPTPADAPSADLERVPCTRCGATQATVLYDLEDYLYQVPGHFASQRCDQCGLIYLSPRPVPQALARYYPDSYAPYRPAIQDERSALMRFMRRRRIAARRRFVERFASAPGRLLDIGASTGIFLDEMRSHGWQVAGIELNEQAAAYARDRFGLDVVCAELSQTGLPAERYSLITLWDVLEHTYDPQAVLRQVWDRLAPGGVVAMTFPAWESLDRRLFGRTWIGYDAPRHLHIFTRPVIEAMLDEAGFQVEANRTTFGGYFTFITSLRTWLRARLRRGRLLATLETLMDLHGARFVFEPFFLLMDALGWGGVRVVVARKRSGHAAVNEVENEETTHG